MDRDCELEAVVRARAFDDAVVVAVANAFDSGFATCWPAGSSALLDDFELALDRATGTTSTRVATAFVAGAASFLARGRTLPPFVPGDEDAPAGALIVAVITEERARFYFRGGVEGLVVRGSEIVARAASRGTHDMIPPDVEDVQVRVSIPDIPLDLLSETGTLDPTVVDVELVAGDRVIVGDWGTGSRLRSVRLVDLDDEALARRAVEPPLVQPARVLGMAAVVRIGPASSRS